MQKIKNEESTKEIAVKQEKSEKQRVPVIASSRVLTDLVPAEHELQVYQAMAAQAESSRFYQNMGGKAGILSMMLYARELGIAPMTAISGGLWNIQGRIEMSARMINSRIRDAGHLMQVVELSPEKCTLIGRRRDTGEEQTVTFTITDAQRANLVKKDSAWEKWPEDMVFARAISRLGRRLFPDIIGTAYAEGEVSDFVDVQFIQSPSEIKATNGRQKWGFGESDEPQETIEQPVVDEKSTEEQSEADELSDEEKRAIQIEDSVKQVIIPYIAEVYDLAARTKVTAAMKVIQDHFGVETLKNLPAERVEELLPYVRGDKFRDDLVKRGLVKEGE